MLGTGVTLGPRVVVVVVIERCYWLKITKCIFFLKNTTLLEQIPSNSLHTQTLQHYQPKCAHRSLAHVLHPSRDTMSSYPHK